MSIPSDPIEARLPLDSEVRALIAATKPEDYDGHTEFGRMSPRERLEWMEGALRFVTEKNWRRIEETEPKP